MGPQMFQRSSNGAYGTLANNMSAALKKTYDEGGSSPTSVISKAIKARRPKTRYVIGELLNRRANGIGI